MSIIKYTIDIEEYVVIAYSLHAEQICLLIWNHAFFRFFPTKCHTFNLDAAQVDRNLFWNYQYVQCHCRQTTITLAAAASVAASRSIVILSWIER